MTPEEFSARVLAEELKKTDEEKRSSLVNVDPDVPSLRSDYDKVLKGISIAINIML